MKVLALFGCLLALAAAGLADESKPPPPPVDDSAPILPRTADIDCGTTQLAPGTYTIESPNYPDNYPDRARCQYSLTAEGGGAMTFSCQAFRLQGGRRCRGDWLAVNGQKYCGRRTPPESTHDGALSIDFRSNRRRNFSGYSCTIEVAAVATTTALPPTSGDTLSCGAATLPRGQYTIRSTNHPDSYPNDEDCRYELSAEQAGDTLSLTCSAFQVEAQSSCSWDWLSVDGFKFCGSSGPSGVTAVSTMAVEWHSDYSVTDTGYLCTLTVGETVTTTTAPPSTSCCCGVPNRASRIVGGVETEVNEYPWQAGLVSPGGTRTWCGGTVINSRFVLTAAHCTRGDSASDIEVLLREHRINSADGEIRATVRRIIEHPRYNPASSPGYDVALLELTDEISFPADNRLAPACLPSDSQFVGVDAVVTGWGTTASGGSQATELQEVTVPVIANDVCRQSYSSIDPSMLCAGRDEGGVDSCQGDSGGPLVTLEADRYSVIGVVSWGIGCARPGYPGVYARVTKVLDWVRTNAVSGTYCA